VVDRKTGGSAEVVNIESIDAEDAAYAEVVKLFDAYAIWALPVVLIDGKVVTWGASQLSKISAAVARAIEPSGITDAKSG
jgi:hypothetical protein